MSALECNYDEKALFFCTTHNCGHKADGTLAPCFKSDCPHCGKRKRARKETTYAKLVEALRKAQDRVARLEAKTARLLGTLVSARREVRSLLGRMETMESEQAKAVLSREMEVVDGR